MTSDTAGFSITVHRAERIIEVHYPARPTLPAFERYETEVRSAIVELAGPWDCLVDQTRLTMLAPELTPRISELNHWARGQGMRHTARVIAPSAVGELQNSRILREAGVQDVGSLFKHRDDAWQHLRDFSR